MKKVMMTVFMMTLLPISNGGLAVSASAINDDTKDLPPSYPDVLPVYNSYYDSSTNQLCIYGAAVSTVINVRVTYRGNEVLYDEVSPEQLPAWYDFSDYDGGTYLVVISAGDSVLCTFSFSKA